MPRNFVALDLLYEGLLLASMRPRQMPRNFLGATLWKKCESFGLQ